MHYHHRCLGEAPTRGSVSSEDITRPRGLAPLPSQVAPTLPPSLALLPSGPNDFSAECLWREGAASGGRELPVASPPLHAIPSSPLSQSPPPSPPAAYSPPTTPISTAVLRPPPCDATICMVPSQEPLLGKC